MVGTAPLVAAVLGSGIAAAWLSPSYGGLGLLENALATALALGAGSRRPPRRSGRSSR